MTIKELKNDNLFLLENFLIDNPKSQENFRYYKKRDLGAIGSHLVTRLYYVGNECVGYGHLDLEDKVWLGICISDKKWGMGYGNKIIDDLISKATSEIFLTVDKNNKAAINLYKKKEFVIEKEEETYFLMKKKIISMDSLGNVIDKLVTVDMKMWDNQELLYEIRKMSFEEYKEKYFYTETGAEKLWSILKKATDLNVQRNQLINEVDEKIIEMFEVFKKGEDLDNGRFLQRSHKTY